MAVDEERCRLARLRLVTLKSRKRGGINDLLELDLFEVSIVPHPGQPGHAGVEHGGGGGRAPRSDQGRAWEPPPKVTPEPAKSVPTAAQQRRQWDRLRLELLTDDLDLEVIEAARDDPAVPTDAELREQAKRSASLSHRREGNQRRFRDDMFDLLMGR